MPCSTYDHASDVFYLRFAPDEVAIAKRQEVAPNVLLDLDAEGGVVGIAVLNVGGARALRFFQPPAPVAPEKER